MDTISEFSKYIDHLNKIRTLSSLSLDGIENANAYSRQLRDNFVYIGRLASENRPILEEELYPLLKGSQKLTAEEEQALIDFEEKLLDPENAECYDLAIAFLLSDRLLEEAMAMQDLLPKLRQMDMQISVCYTMMNMTARITEYPEISRYYRQKGIELGQLFLVFREKENFAKIPEQEARELILTNARFTAAFYEIITGDEPRNKINLEMLRGSFRILEDPFYIDSVPGYDWRHYRYRLLFYFAQLTDYGNCRQFNESQFPEICDRTEELWDLWHTDPAYFSEMDKESIVEFQLLKNRYYAGRITSRAYIDGLHRIYLNRDKNAYDVWGIIENFQLPIEMYYVFRNEHFSAALKAQISYYFNNMMAYIFHMPNSGSLHFLLELNTHVLACFVELPGKITFETMMLHMLAAFHPPTYVHSRMVAEFSICLCDHLIRISPGLLIGIEGCQTEEDVLKNKDALLNYTWHAALCHDTGKLFIIDTIFVYGRKLLDTEFDLIKTHPRMGAATLSRFSSTKKYADVALGHHKWYDNSRGYPEDFDTGKSPVKTIIDIVQCADCLDAATDTVGRSYNRGKNFDDLYEEICEGSGTRYAPWLPGLLARPEVRKDIEYLLAAGRDQNYHDTYLLLKTMQEKEI